MIFAPPNRSYQMKKMSTDETPQHKRRTFLKNVATIAGINMIAPLANAASTFNHENTIEQNADLFVSRPTRTPEHRVPNKTRLSQSEVTASFADQEIGMPLISRITGTMLRASRISWILPFLATTLPI